MVKELDELRAIFESSPQKKEIKENGETIDEWNSQFEAVQTAKDPDSEFNLRIDGLRKRYEDAKAKHGDPKKAADEAMNESDENFSLLEHDCPEEDETTQSEREQREHEMKVNRMMDSWFDAKRAAMNAKFEELKLKYPDNPEKIKVKFDEWLRLTEAALSGQDDEKSEDKEPKEKDVDDSDGKDGDDELASEKDLDDEDETEDPEDPPAVDDPEDDSVLNDSDSDDENNEEFTEEENEIVDALIESETDALSDYSKALNETSNPNARTLYTEILGEETKHLAQLKYLKAKMNGQDYVPKDTEAKDEVDELLEGVLSGDDIL